MWCLREAIAWDGWADDLKHHITLLQAVLGRLCEQGDDLVELVEGAGPTVDHQQRLNSSTVRDVGGLHMDKMDIYPCHTFKTDKLSSGSITISALDSEEGGWQNCN